MRATHTTTRDLDLVAWANVVRGGYPFTLPAGSAVALVKGLSGTTGDGFVVASVRQLTELTGNAHDAVHRYVEVPADAVVRRMLAGDIMRWDHPAAVWAMAAGASAYKA
jgi:hypothetical protein